jgi:ubiquinone/menaquinone biosynthesis C-methylase UbiE
MSELERLDFQHHIFRHVLRSNYLAPIERPKDILDAGCGTGRWAMEMADQFPQARVVGLDIAVPPVEAGIAVPTRPRPANYAFVQANLLEPLPFPDASFDFVHQRLLCGSFPARAWQGEVHRLARVTRPGGWVELVEGGLMRGHGPGIGAFNRWLIEISAQRGTDVQIGQHIDRFLRVAGLQRVTMRQGLVPIGRWGGSLGRAVETNTFAFLNSVRGLIVGSGEVNAAAYEQNTETIRAEIARGGCTFPYYVAYGQRPPGQV